MHGLVLGDLTIDVTEVAADRLALHWTGASNSRDPGNGLKPFLDVALADASSRGAVLELHFEKLGHFNSSTMATLLRFIDQAGRRKVRLALYYDASLRWQSHNFEAVDLLHRQGGLVEVHRLGSGAAREHVDAG